jgi:excisionase family DNA binding protein
MATTKIAAPTDDRLLTARDVAQFLGIPMATLYSWRTRGIAPRAVRVGKHLRFRRADVDAWVDQHVDDRAGAA